MSEIDGKPDRSPISTVTLSVVEGPASGTQYLYSERTTAIAGRADECEPRIDEPGSRPLVLRHHCLFDINPPAIRVRDFGSLNGTYVNGEEIGRRRHDQPPKEGSRQIFAERDLVDGDRITLGSTVLQVEVTDPQQTLIDPSTTESCSECGDLVGAETQEAIGETIIRRLQAGEIVLPGTDPVHVVLEEDAVPIRQRDHTIPKSLAEVIDAALVDNPRIDTISAFQLAAALREAL
jgi:pSer/pThr/pTyr-binding forkhead associated (FHA) protein